MTYRVAPQSTTEVLPAELLLGRRPRTRLDLIKPNTAERVKQRQLIQKAGHDVKTKTRVFHKADTVFAKNFGSGRRWLPGKMIEVTGPVSFRVKLSDGRQHRYHQGQLRHRYCEEDVTETSDVEYDDSMPIVADSTQTTSSGTETTAVLPANDTTDITKSSDLSQETLQQSNEVLAPWYP